MGTPAMTSTPDIQKVGFALSANPIAPIMHQPQALGKPQRLWDKKHWRVLMGR
jgi:hypothetical protein